MAPGTSIVSVRALRSVRMKTARVQAVLPDGSTASYLLKVTGPPFFRRPVQR